MPAMKRSLPSLLAALTALFLPLAASAAPTPVPVAAIDRATRRILHALKTPGATIAVAENGRIVYARGYGLRNLAAKEGADVNTHYEIGSMTKQFTAAAILQLRDAGKLSLDESVAKILPRAPHANQITIRQLLTHTSGLANYTNVSGFVRMAARPGSYAKIIASIAKKPLEFKPGSHWRYSNTNYILLGRIVEVLSHEPYRRYIDRHEFARAGMTHTHWISDEAGLSDMALGYRPLKNGGVAPSFPLHDRWAWSAGAIVSTVGDLVRWNEALRSGKIVTRRDYREMTTPVRVAVGSSGGYGFGLIRDRHDGQLRISHDGGTFGFSSDAAFFPSQHLTIVALTNSASGPATTIVNNIFDAIHPRIAAAADATAPGENLGVTARVKAFVIPLLRGDLNRSQITPAASKALSDAAVKAASQQLSVLGPPTAFVFRGSSVLPDATKYVYLVRFKATVLKLTVAIDAKSKKFAAFFFQSP